MQLKDLKIAVYKGEKFEYTLLSAKKGRFEAVYEDLELIVESKIRSLEEPIEVLDGQKVTLNGEEYIVKARYDYVEIGPIICTNVGPLTYRGGLVLDYVSRLPNGHHGKDHLIRTWRNGLLLAENIPNVRYEILEPALLLHDIVRPVSSENHAHLSAERAADLLPCFGYDELEVELICEAIRHHSWPTGRPWFLEAKIVYDADKMDGLGKAGIERVILLAKDKGVSLREAAEWYEMRIETQLKSFHFRDLVLSYKKKDLEYSLEWIKRQKVV